MTKLSDVKPGQFFRHIRSSGLLDSELYLKIAIDADATYRYRDNPARRHLAIRTSNFKIATWSEDGDVEVINPEDV